MDVQYGLEILNYTAPIVVLLHYLIASAASVSIVYRSQDAHPKAPRNTIVVIMLLIAATYASEAGIIISQLLGQGGQTAKTDRNVHALASAIEWSFFSVFLVTSKFHRWYPYWGSGLVALAAEVTILSLHASYFRTTLLLEQVQTALAALRIPLFVSLPAVLLAVKGLRASQPSSDEESAPLLAHAQVASEDMDNINASAKYGSTTNENPTKDDPNDETDDDSKDRKKELENLERVQRRVEESGSWWSYARRFLGSLAMIFAPYMWPSKKPRLHFNMFVVGLCILAKRAMRVLVPRQLGLTVDAMTQSNGHNPFVELAFYALFSVISSNAGIGAIKNWCWLPVEANAYHEIDTASYNHIMELSSDFHDSKQSGELYMAMQQGRSVIDLLESILYELAPVLVDLVVACFYFFYLFDAYMLLIVGTTIAAFLFISQWMTTTASSMRRSYTKASRRQFQVLHDTMSGWRTVSYFNRLPHAKDSYSSSNMDYTQIALKHDIFYFFLFSIQDLVLDVGLFSACFFAAYRIVYGDRTVGDLVTLLTYWANLAGPLFRLSMAHRKLLSNLIDAEQLLDLFNTKVSIKDGSDELRLDKGRVDFNRVQFTYDGDKKIINDVSFNAVAGKTIALIGETGGGKSTILKLLFRFYDPSEGNILIDGQNIRNVTLHSLRENIGVVPQDPSLFNDTILTNLRYAKLDAKDEEIIEACKAAAVHDKIVSFTKGYMSKVGENGVKLSGGELQRIAIARAILKDPKIILLDEATSSVDSETEGMIQQALDKLSKGRTTFIVAHRLSTIKDADLIIVIKDGAVLEQGPPAELLASKGKYYSLWMKQMNLVDHSTQDPIAENPASEDLMDQSQPHKENSQSGRKVLGKDKEMKRPTLPNQALRNKPKNVLSFSGKKMFRPEAPEFVPQSRPTTAISKSSEESQSTRKHGYETSTKPDKDRNPRSRKRKTKQDTTNTEVHDTAQNDVQGGPSSTAQLYTDGPSDKAFEGPQAKRSRFRRAQTKSEPPPPGPDDSQNDGPNDLRTANGGSFRHVSAPVVPPSEPEGPRRRSQRRRQRHWREKNRSVSGTSRNTSGTQSSAVSGDEWADDVPDRRGSVAPTTSPAGETVDSGGRKGEGSGTVRFVDGS